MRGITLKVYLDALKYNICAWIVRYVGASVLVFGVATSRHDLHEFLFEKILLLILLRI